MTLYDDSDYNKVVMRTEGYITTLLIHRSLDYLLDTITEAINTPVRAPRTPNTIHRAYSSKLAVTGIPAWEKLMVALLNEYMTTPVTNPATEHARNTSGSESVMLRR